MVALAEPPVLAPAPGEQEDEGINALCWGSKRLRTSGNDIKLARTPGSTSISSGAAGTNPTTDCQDRTPEQPTDEDQPIGERKESGDSTPRNDAPTLPLEVCASPAAAELLMTLCQAVSESTVTADNADAMDPSDDDGIGSGRQRGSARPRRRGPKSASGTPRAGAGPGSSLAGGVSERFQYRFGPGQPSGGATPRAGAVRQKSCAFVGVRKRQWGTFAAEIRNQMSGSREWLGTFESAEEAAVVYDMRLRQIKGASAKCNFPPLDMSGPLIKREICPHGKQAPHRLTLMIPENWLQQVVALQSGVVRPTTGQPSAPGNAEDAEEPAAAPAAADVKQEDGGELGQPETEPAATAEEAATHVSGEGVNGKVEDQGAPAVEPSAGSPAVDGSQAER